MSRNPHAARIRRHARVRKKVSGTSARPRLAVFRSNRHVHAQLIDDVAGRTLAAASTEEASLRSATTAPVERAGAVGKLLADPKLQARMADLGGEPMPMTPSEFGKLVADETGKWGKVVKFSGAKAD